MQVGMVYWTVKDLGSKMAHRLEHIYLSMLLWTKDIDHHGWRAVMGLPGSVVSDLKCYGFMDDRGAQVMWLQHGTCD